MSWKSAKLGWRLLCPVARRIPKRLAALVGLFSIGRLAYQQLEPSVSTTSFVVRHDQ